jgi:hypothetical protein
MMQTIKKQMSLRAAVVMGLAIPAAAAMGQATGTSHPDEVIVTTENGVKQPVYVPTPTPAYAPAASAYVSTPPAYVPTPAVAMAPAPVAVAATEFKPYKPYDPDAMVVGDNPGGVVEPMRAPDPDNHAADMDAGVVTRVAGPANGLPVGTLVRTKMLQDFSTKTTVEGSEWRAELMEPLMRDGRVLIPAGAVVRGRVTSVHGGRRITGQAGIHLQTLAVMMPDGTSMGMHGQVIDTSISHSTLVDNEGTILHRDHKKEEAGVLALTAGSGVAAGAVLGGVPGALIGAGVGVGISTVIWLKADRQAEMPKGTQVTFELTRAMVLGQE